MKSRSYLTVCVIMAITGLVLSTAGTVRAGTPASSLPQPPSGYQQYYYHNFAAGGLTGWNIWPGATASTKTSANGVAITVTKADQQAEVVSDGAMVTPGSFIQGYVYLPAAKGKIANFPALWALSANYKALWNKGVRPGETDLMEGLSGRVCSHTHYAGEAPGPAGVCAPVATFAGWHTFSALWESDKVKFWYDSIFIGTLPLPSVLAGGNEILLFQNRSYGTFCTQCYGPSQYPSSAWLAWVKVWHKS